MLKLLPAFLFISLYSYAGPGDSLTKKACVLPESVRNSSKKMLILSPSISYAPETRIAGGIYSMYYFRLGPKGTCTRPSTVLFSPSYSMNKQFVAEPAWDLCFKNDNYLTTGRLLYQNYREMFFGVGNHTREIDGGLYSHQLIRFITRIQKRWYSRFFAGFQYQLQDMFGIYEDRPGLLGGEGVVGGKGSIISGPGVAFTWDSRDVPMNASKGSYMEFSNYFFEPVFGSQFSFISFTYDARKYYTLFKKTVVAGQAFLQHSSGEVPFRMMNLVGNNQLMRGYYSGRYRDKNYLAGQLEYRFPVVWRIGMVLFGGAGEVSPTLPAFRIDDFHYSYGFGLRYLYDREERLNIRLDLGFGPGGMSGQYITVGEAF